MKTFNTPDASDPPSFNALTQDHKKRAGLFFCLLKSVCVSAWPCTLTVGFIVLPSVAGVSFLVVWVGVEFLGASAVVRVGVVGDSAVVVWIGEGVRFLWEKKQRKNEKLQLHSAKHSLGKYFYIPICSFAFK